MHESATRNFHLPLPDETYRLIRLEAERRQRSVTALVREVLHEWLERQRVQALHAAIASYAAKNAGTSVDLDAALEAAGVEAITSGLPNSPKRKAKSR